MCLWNLIHSNNKDSLEENSPLDNQTTYSFPKKRDINKVERTTVKLMIHPKQIYTKIKTR